MKELEKRIKEDGKVINNQILKVDSFINHQIDTKLLLEISKYLASHFEGVTKILTIETSGIAFALGVAEQYDNIPLVFAKKSKSKIVDENNLYLANIKSFTRDTTSLVCVDKRFITKEDKILIVDDFLAEGNASLGLIDICNQAGAKVLGVAVAVEKSFQGGRGKLEKLGYKVVSGASIKAFADGQVIFD